MVDNYKHYYTAYANYLIDIYIGINENYKDTHLYSALINFIKNVDVLTEFNDIILYLCKNEVQAYADRNSLDIKILGIKEYYKLELRKKRIKEILT